MMDEQISCFSAGLGLLTLQHHIQTITDISPNKYCYYPFRQSLYHNNKTKRNYCWWYCTI